MSRIQLGQKVQLANPDGSVLDVTVEHLFKRRGRELAGVRFADSHFDIVDTSRLSPGPPQSERATLMDRYLNRIANPIRRFLERVTDLIARGVFVGVLVGGALLVLWIIALSVNDCGLADNFDYVTKRCALSHLQRASCNLERDIFTVDEISDTSYTDDKGKRVELRSVIYQFRKRPLNGPVSADVLRDTEIMYKDAQGHWKAGCER